MPVPPDEPIRESRRPLYSLHATSPPTPVLITRADSRRFFARYVAKGQHISVVNPPTPESLRSSFEYRSRRGAAVHRFAADMIAARELQVLRLDANRSDHDMPA